jgi:predicted metal-dependent phosphoesterase TrpH
MIFDIHVHTSISACSSIHPDELIGHARNLGLDGICITDHETLDVTKYITEGLQSNGLLVIIGMEYETTDGDFLIFGPYEDLKSGLDAVSLLTHIRQTGGAAIGAHPFREDRPLNENLIKDNYCTIIESANGRNNGEDDKKLSLWRNKYSLFEVGGSDAHSLKELGRTSTRFTIPITSRSDLIQALHEGLCSPVVIPE